MTLLEAAASGDALEALTANAGSGFIGIILGWLTMVFKGAISELKNLKLGLDENTAAQRSTQVEVAGNTAETRALRNDLRSVLDGRPITIGKESE